uniref:Uncharacterized protein n=1 Tax=Arundo donax TaxID=35708 RepID=A0A0A9AL65_ARUDO
MIKSTPLWPVAEKRRSSKSFWMRVAT